MNQRITEIRKDLNKTQEVFASDTGISRGSLAKIEIGAQEPPYSFVKTLHNKFGINLNWLICGSGKKRMNVTNDVNEDISLYGLNNIEIINNLRDLNEFLKKENSELKQKLEDCQKNKEQS